MTDETGIESAYDEVFESYNKIWKSTGNCTSKSQVDNVWSAPRNSELSPLWLSPFWTALASTTVNEKNKQGVVVMPINLFSELAYDNAFEKIATSLNTYVKNVKDSQSSIESLA